MSEKKKLKLISAVQELSSEARESLGDIGHPKTYMEVEKGINDAEKLLIKFIEDSFAAKVK